MISDNISKALNEQITNEFNSAYRYLAMSAHFSSRNLNGFAHWFRVQYNEERNHALRIFDHIIDRGGEVSLSPVSEPPRSWESPTAAFSAALEEERRIAKSIDELMELAIGEKDHATRILLDWFVSEQVEEERVTSEIVDQLQMVGDSTIGLFMMDERLMNRSPEEADAEQE
ncbi:MAG: ferritin [Spirochaetaceae bacterium]|nr:ferritin [Spirochaetaceae bacterium]